MAGLQAAADAQRAAVEANKNLPKGKKQKVDRGAVACLTKGRDWDDLAGPAIAGLEGGPLDVEYTRRHLDLRKTSNDWEGDPNGQGHREGLEGVGRRELDDLSRRAEESYEREAEGKPRRQASLERDTRTEADVLKEDAADTGRRFLSRGKEGLKKIKSADGRPVGEQLAEQLRQRREYHERTSSRMTSTFNRALDSFRKAKGKGWMGDWDMVVEALDGQTDYASLDTDQQNLYTITRALLNQTKKDAQREEVFAAQSISKYFPHIHPDGRLSEDGAIDAHAEWLETTEEGQKRLATLQAEDLQWLSGVLGEEASTRELAQMDLSRNFNRSTFWTSNPHLEKHRSSRGLPFRRDPDVIRYYLDKAYDRIATGRYLGAKNEHGFALLRTMKKGDREFAADVVQDALGLPGGKPRSKMGRLVERGARELSALQGLAKLGMAALPQITQLASSTSEAAGTQGLIKGVSNSVRSAVEMFTQTERAYADAERAGSTFAATSGESMKSFAGAGQRTLVEGIFKRVLGERLIGSTYFVRDLDKAARVIADNTGRAVYLDALRSKDLDTLTDLLGRKELAQEALKKDAPRVDELQRMWKEGRLGDASMRLFRPQKHGAQYPQGVGFDAAAERMDAAGKRFADKTQYRTFSENEPVAFRSPIVKAANTFYSFHLQHLNWQWDHFKGYKAAMKSGNKKAAWKHARTLMSYHMIMAPIIGQAALSIRSLLTGGGVEEKEVDTPGEAWEGLFGLDPIKAEDEWTAALRVLQGWQFAGGFGYPASIAERTTRAYEKSAYDPGRAMASFAGGAPGETLYDAGVLAANWARYAIKRMQNLDTPADWDKAVRQSIRASGHVIPNPFGAMSAARRKALEGVGDPDRKKPQTRGGWELLFDPEAYWTPATGMTTAEIEEAKEDARAEREEEREEAAEKAEDARRDRGWE
jgi:hypothetical protein